MSPAVNPLEIALALSVYSIILLTLTPPPNRVFPVTTLSDVLEEDVLLIVPAITGDPCI
jgi:hypothetical protein